MAVARRTKHVVLVGWITRVAFVQDVMGGDKRTSNRNAPGSADDSNLKLAGDGSGTNPQQRTYAVADRRNRRDEIRHSRSSRPLLEVGPTLAMTGRSGLPDRLVSAIPPSNGRTHHFVEPLLLAICGFP